MINGHTIAAVLPCYRVRNNILRVLEAMPPEVDKIFCIDDCCPEQSGDFIEASCHDPRVQVIRHTKNLGVGGAVKTGYVAALAANIDIIGKVDGDGQMDPALLPSFCEPIANGLTDYVKGNRFHNLEDAQSMPLVRWLGNGALSFITKLSSGYYNLIDPTNGYTAIHRCALADLPLEKISNRYFFESDMLFRLGISRAVVLDRPMKAVYADEKSSLKIGKVLGEFACKHFLNCLKRIWYLYLLRDFNVGTIQLGIAITAIPFGVIFGAYHWIHSTGLGATAGTVMLSALPIILGFQALMAFLQYDIGNIPRIPLHAMHRWSK